MHQAMRSRLDLITMDRFDEIFVNVKDSLYGFRDDGNPIRVDMPNGF
jgi:hypothetical protein